jgi:hypothetical protein
MEIRVEINFEYLLENSWSGALDNLKTIDKYDLGEEFMSYLEEMFYDSTPTDTEVNDAIWFMEQPTVEDWIAEHISIDDIDDLDELEDYAKNLCYTDVVATIRDFTANNREELLWDYINNNYDHYSLKEVFEELENISVSDLEEDE